MNAIRKDIVNPNLSVRHQCTLSYNFLPGWNESANTSISTTMTTNTQSVSQSSHKLPNHSLNLAPRWNSEALPTSPSCSYVSFVTERTNNPRLENHAWGVLMYSSDLINQFALNSTPLLGRSWDIPSFTEMANFYRLIAHWHVDCNSNCWLFVGHLPEEIYPLMGPIITYTKHARARFVRKQFCHIACHGFET